MPRSKKKVDEEAVLDAAVVENDSDLPVVASVSTEGDEAPRMTDLGWSDHVLDQLGDDEKDADGNPRVDGLRRVAELLLGPIVRAVANIEQSPNMTNGLHASVSFEVAIAWGGNPMDVRVFGDVADVYGGNTEPNFARFATATASTKAEARALRKALKLRKVAADELTTVPVAESGLTGLITEHQVRAITKHARDLDISVMEFINLGKSKYKHITHVTYENAGKMLEFLNGYLQNPSSIPESIKGYDPDWRDG